MVDFYDRFARAVARMVDILDPDAIVLGGGLSNIDALYRRVAVARGTIRVHSGRTDQDRQEHTWRFQRRARRGLAVARGRGRRPAPRMNAFCRDCLADAADGARRCKACGELAHQIEHPELATSLA